MATNSKFEELRIQLYGEMMQWQDDEGMTEEFKSKFFKLIEFCTFSMMESEDNFFALFTMQMKREIKLDLPTAVANTASLSHFIIYFNPYIFLECSLDEMKALIKHEVYHIMYNHLKRSENIRGKYSDLAISRAMDISINQYIKHMPLWSDNIENVSLTYNIDLKKDLTMEEYAKIIQEGIDKLRSSKGPKVLQEKERDFGDLVKRTHDFAHAHDVWLQSEDSFNFEQIKDITNKAISNATRGKIPNEFKNIIEDINRKTEISWKEYLKKVIGTIPYGYKKTITRKDRRQPNRLDLRGRVSKRIAKIIVAIDISGSITDKEIDQIMTEIFGIVKNHHAEITILECDNQIRRVYNVKSKKDIKAKLDRKGGTAFSPVFEYIYRYKLREHFLIYFTDGIGEEELRCLPINYKTLWVITGKGEKLSIKRAYGVVKKLSDIKVEAADRSYAKDAMKDILMEWAK